MARNNPYAMDPNLIAGFSNLTRALLGSADDDAAIARANASNASATNSLAQADANQALARGRRISADRMEELAGIAGGNNSALMGQMAKVLGLDARQDELGNLVEPKNPLGPQMSVPAFTGADGVGTDGGLGNLANAFFGDLSFNPQQFTAGLNNLSEGANNTLARSILMDPTASLSEQASAFKSMGYSPGANFDETLARYKVNSDSEDARNDARRDQEAAEYKTDAQFGPGGQGDRDARGRKDWQNYSARRILEAKVKVANITDDRERDIAKAALDAETKRLESKDINDQYVAVNGNLVLSEALATQLGIGEKVTIDGQEVYAIRQPSPNEAGVKIYLGKGEDAPFITVTSASLDKIAPVNIDGRLTIPPNHKWGSENKAAATEDQLGASAIQEIDAQVNPLVAGWSDANVPDIVTNKIREMVNQTIVRMGEGVNLLTRISESTKMLNDVYKGQSIIKITKGSNFGVPAIVLNTIKGANVPPSSADVSDIYGFTLSQSERILSFLANDD